MNFIKDDDFIRNNIKEKTVPLTKREIRILTLGLMEINPDDYFLDLGGGTGGIACEVSRKAYNGMVISVDKDIKACDLIKQNKNKFNLNNLTVYNMEAIEFLDSYDGPKFNKIFIGGSGGKIKEIIKRSHKVLKRNGIIACNFISIENCYKAFKELKEKYNSTELLLVNISNSKDIKDFTILKSLNPVFILTAKK